jgi:hypothetical protein
MLDVFKILGASGLLLISIGLLIKNRVIQNMLFICGGTLLEMYSIHIQDIIFTVLQFVFILSAFFDLVRR